LPSGRGKIIVTKVPAVEESEQIVSNEEFGENDEAPQSLAQKAGAG
jgi:hypothetical protein